MLSTLGSSTCRSILAIWYTTPTCTAFPSALNVAVLVSGTQKSSSKPWSRSPSTLDRCRRSGPSMGICVLVIATSDGLLAYLLTRSPEGLN